MYYCLPEMFFSKAVETTFNYEEFFKPVDVPTNADDIIEGTHLEINVEVLDVELVLGITRRNTCINVKRGLGTGFDKLSFEKYPLNVGWYCKTCFRSNIPTSIIF